MTANSKVTFDAGDILVINGVDPTGKGQVFRGITRVLAMNKDTSDEVFNLFNYAKGNLVFPEFMKLEDLSNKLYTKSVLTFGTIEEAINAINLNISDVPVDYLDELFAEAPTADNESSKDVSETKESELDTSNSDSGYSNKDKSGTGSDASSDKTIKFNTDTDV